MANKKKKLSLLDLAPERDTFAGEEGEEYEFAVQQDFSAKQLTRLMKLQKRVEWALVHFDPGQLSNGAGPEDEPEDGPEDGPDQVDRAAELLDEALYEYIRLIIPDLPVVELDRYKTGVRLNIVNWWNKNVLNATPSGEEAGEAGAS
jgi:hypothetical protein